MGGSAISPNMRVSVLDECGWICSYCLTPLVDNKLNKYADNYPCCNLFVPKAVLGKPTRNNLVGCCRKCSTIKNDLDPNTIGGGLDDVRDWINTRRFAMRLPYVEKWIRNKPQRVLEPQLEVVIPGSPTPIVRHPEEFVDPLAVPMAAPIDSDDDKAEDSRQAALLQAMKAGIIKELGEPPTFTKGPAEHARPVRNELHE